MLPFAQLPLALLVSEDGLQSVTLGCQLLLLLAAGIALPLEQVTKRLKPRHWRPAALFTQHATRNTTRES